MKDPTQIHRSLLEAQREVILSLRRFETIHEVRREKIRELYKLRRTVYTASQMFAHLQAHLPKVEGHVRRKVADQPKPKTAPEPMDDAELARLDRELGEIEKKLHKL